MARILIVDDFEDTARLLARLLSKSGHATDYVTSGEAALARVAAATTNDGIPDIVILDFMMPGMDGLEVLRRLKSQRETAGIRVVLYTAVFDPSFEQHARDKGADDYWPKSRMGFDVIAERIAQLSRPN